MIKYYINARIITLCDDDPFIENGYIKVSGTKITKVGSMSEYEASEPESGAEIEDVCGKILMPGMVCTHSHFYGQLIRGMAVGKRLRNWQQVLQDLWWDVDRAIDDDITNASAVMGLVEGVKCGVTTFIDHHASPAACTGSLDIIENAVKRIGARAVLAYEVSDRNGERSRKEGLLENERFIAKCAGRDENDTVRGMFGLHALYSLSPQTLAEAVEMEKPYDVGFHIHCAEDRADVVCSYKNYDKHVVEFLYEQGILKPKSILAHFVHTGSEEWDIVAGTGTTIAHNAQSNCSNGVGVCHVNEMLDKNVHVALGGDGFYYNLFEELKIAMLVQKLCNGPEALGGDKMKRLAFSNPYRVVENAFGIAAGKIAAGYQADFILLDYDNPTPLHAGNLMGHIADAFTGHVTDTIINGKRVVENGIVLGLDNAAFEDCRKQAARLEKRFAAI